MQSHWLLGGLSLRELSLRVYNETTEDDIFGSAAQLAYYFLFALFPLLIFLTTIFGFLVGADAELRASLFSYLAQVLPGSASELVSQTIQEVSSSSTGGKLTLGLFLALWAASSGMEAVTQTLNNVYDLEETRPWWKRRLIALGLTVALALLIISALVIILFGNHIIDAVAASFGFGDIFRTGWKIAQYALALVFVLLSFSLIYYWSPDVREQKWYWVTPGSLIGVGLWLLVSIAFRIYLSYFDSYSATYGSLGAVIVLLLWLYFTGAAILIGGTFNSEIENAAAEAGRLDAKAKGEKESPNGKTDKSAEAVGNETAAQQKNKQNDEQKPGQAVTSQTAAAHSETAGSATASTAATRKNQTMIAGNGADAATHSSDATPKNFLTRITAVGSMLTGIFYAIRGNGKNRS